MKTIPRTVLAALSAVLFILRLYGQSAGAGKVDLTFNPITGAPSGFPNNVVEDVVGLAGGKSLVAGAFTLPPSTARRGLVRLNSNGARDTNFVGYANGSVSRLIPLSDGRYYIFGSFTTVNGISRINFALIDADGNLDPGWVPTGLGTSAVRERIALGGDDKLLVNTASNLMARVGFDGAPEDSWHVPGVNFLSRVAAHPGGGIYVIGFTSDPPYSPILTALNADGSPSTNFVSPHFTNAISTSPPHFTAMTLDSAGRVLISGDFTHVNGAQRVGIARLNADGSLDGSFVPGPGGIGTTVPGGLVPVDTIVPQPDGRILLGRDGPFRFAGTFRPGVARISSTGAFDGGFDPGSGPKNTAYGGVSGDGFGIRCLAVSPAGEIYAGGSFTNFNSTGKRFMVRLNRGAISAPGIASPPQSQSVASGADVVFNVVASGAAPFAYVWSHNGAIIPGATSDTLTLQNVQLADVGGYLVKVSNAGGSATAAPAVLTVDGVSVPDLKGPTFAITSPSGTFVRSTAGQYTFRGTSRDNLGLASVSWQQNGNLWVKAPLMTNWSFDVTLDPGTNKFRVFATDIAGNHSVTQAVTVFYVVTQTLALTINGSGVVSGATNGQGFEIGRYYSMKASPRPGNLFSNWVVNGSAATNPSLSVFMWSNTTVSANFVTNPFIALKGAYYGLFFQSNSPAWDSSGYFSLAVGSNGSYSGKMLLGAASHLFSGGFDLSLASAKRIARTGKPELLLELQLGADSDRVVGRVGSVGFSSELLGWRAALSAARPASDYAGKYTLLFSGGPDPVLSPSGNGFASLSVSSSGTAKVATTLADGSVASQSVPLGARGHLPLYLVLYGGKGSAFGWVELDDDSSASGSDDRWGQLLWTKASMTTGAFYRGGFTNFVEVMGASYISTNKPLITMSNAAVFVEGANFTGSAADGVSLSAANKFIIAGMNTNKLRLGVIPASGVVTGAFVNPHTRRTSSVRGVLLQDRGSVGGFSLGTNQSGIFYLGPPEDYPLLPPSP
jgi:uncharacterized delta-60 repeat protein